MRDNRQVGLYVDDGIVLRTQDLGEADRIVTILTRRTGRVRAVGKGVRRTKSRFGARLEPFTHVDLQLHTGRSLDYVTQADTVRAYGETLSADDVFEAFQLAPAADFLKPDERRRPTGRPDRLLDSF